MPDTYAEQAGGCDWRNERAAPRQTMAHCVESFLVNDLDTEMSVGAGNKRRRQSDRAPVSRAGVCREGQLIEGDQAPEGKETGRFNTSLCLLWMRMRA